MGGQYALDLVAQDDTPAILPSRKNGHGPSFLRWAGSKRKSLAELAATYRDDGWHYIEPFAGSATLFFSLLPKAATLADLNIHLINALRYVRDCPVEVHEELSTIVRDATTYYAIRNEFNALRGEGLRSAVLFLYLNRNCFNGLWRTNKAGAFNVPFGGTEMGAHPPLTLINTCSQALKNASIKHQDFRRTLEEAGLGDFVYADPPYFTGSERTFIEYGQKSFDADDLNDLTGLLVSAADRGARIALTYSALMPLDDHLPGWQRTVFEVTRNVGGFSGSRRKHREVLYTSHPA